MTEQDYKAEFTEDDAANANADAGLDDHGDAWDDNSTAAVELLAQLAADQSPEHRQRIDPHRDIYTETVTALGFDPLRNRAVRTESAS